ncbi:MAG: PqqD family protein [Desulfobacteraceae bacterium]|nr:PqqD family protein [Desulfobacteraceae bacterium]
MAYELSKEYLWKEVKERVVVLHFDSGKYYSLNTTGSLIWKSLIENISRDEIVNQVCLEFDIDRQTAENDTEEIINDFLSKKFIKKV